MDVSISKPATLNHFNDKSTRSSNLKIDLTESSEIGMGQKE